MNKPVFTFKNLQGILYKVFYGKAVFSYKRKGKTKKITVCGVCDSPDEKNPKIIIDNELKSREELATIAEEFLHSFQWGLKEKEVRPFANTLAKFLIQEGWRKTKK